MNHESRGPHLTFDSLVEYWLGQADDADAQRADMHLLGCDACGAMLDEVISLARGVQRAFSDGLVAAFISDAFVARLHERRVRVREYRVAQNSSVNCIVAPEDDILVGRLEAPLEGVSRVDVAIRRSLADEEHWVNDVPFDAVRGEVLFTPKLVALRELPTHDMHIRLLACDDMGRHEIGHYTFHHHA
jgi:hypothetical protein